MLDPQTEARLRNVQIPELVDAVDDTDALRSVLEIVTMLESGLRWKIRALHDEAGYSWREIGRARDEGRGLAVDRSGGNVIRDCGNAEKPQWLIRAAERTQHRLTAIADRDSALADEVRSGMLTLGQAEVEIGRRDRREALKAADPELWAEVQAGTVTLDNAVKRLRDRAQRAEQAKARNERRLADLRKADRGLFASVKAGDATLDEAEQQLRTLARMRELEDGDRLLYGQVLAGELTLKQGLDRLRGRQRREAAQAARAAGGSR